MSLDGALREVEALGNLPIGEPFNHERQQFAVVRSQRWHVDRDPQRARDRDVVAQHHPNDRSHDGLCAGLYNYSVDMSAEERVGPFATRRADDDDARAWYDPLDSGELGVGGRLLLAFDHDDDLDLAPVALGQLGERSPLERELETLAFECPPDAASGKTVACRHIHR
jgi:hypothetical protein